MSIRGRVIGAVAGGLGLAAAGTVYGVAHQSRALDQRPAHDPDEQLTGVPGDRGPALPGGLGSLRSPPMTVVASDGVPLHVEVDELDDTLARALPTAPADLTVVFVHGYCLTLDCWHFQRAAYRGRVRTVFYDQRSHGRSGRSARENATIDQLGNDLAAVVDTAAPEGPVVLVGHSMGGMSVLSYLAQHPGSIGERVVGVGLVSTTAGGLDPGRILLPLVPSRLSGQVTGTAVRTLDRSHRVVDSVRRVGRVVGRVGTDVFSFGGDVPSSYVDFADQMLSATPFSVVADFYPGFRGFDLFATVGALGAVPTTIVSATADRLISIGHSRKLHARIPGSRLREVVGAGHLALIERHVEVTAEIELLLQRVAARLERLES